MAARQSYSQALRERVFAVADDGEPVERNPVSCILAWRVFWMTIMQHAAQDATAKLVLTSTEITLLDRLVPDKTHASLVAGTVSASLTKVARLGGYLARAKDPPPGDTIT